ncbi:MAG: 30S ribosomal protein S15 [Patescibacteria group bacterium]|nr:30S ribosomal protein S15 [Patescibacteria group bacterium]MDD5121119.1 30S ribosomal protein S15 [Patescibacteria group bacterium]MDD5222152.1 30S ribosomal protein S15 [Patescibacteria group bacterium]MDD5395962.1 30S ribosomal protein S15 [Patescibacteria group bacterium]
MNKKKEIKKAVIKNFQKKDQDTGSVEVQIGLLTKEISQLTDHLKKNKQDFSSRRGLLRKVAHRRKLLKYLQHNDPKSYEKIVKKIKTA